MKHSISAAEQSFICTVKQVTPVSEDVFTLQITREGIRFEPGEYLSIYAADRVTSRQYSIASGVNDPLLTFLIKHMAQGVVTDYLQQLKTGEKIRVSSPGGNFRPGRQHRSGDFIFIATGTGIAPFLSYLQSYPQHPPRLLLYGVRHRYQAIGFDFFQEKCPAFLAVSREKAAGCYHGRVTHLLSRLPVAKNIHYYLCGLDAMISEVTQWLKSSGIPAQHIHHEIFFHTDIAG